MSPRQFENAIAELFRKFGYEVKQTPFSNDGGKDAIAIKDGKKYLIECKRYAADNSVGRRDIQIFVAAIQEEKANGGYYVNTGVFTQPAIAYAKKNNILLYDRQLLASLINQAYPVSFDAGHTNVMCLECGAVTSMPLLDHPVTGTCSNGHSITSGLVKADLRVLSSCDIPYCERCGAPMTIVALRGRRFWGCSRYPACKASKSMSHG
jgi:restriction system protein